MKTKALLLLCLFLGIGLARLTAQNSSKNIDRSYATRMEHISGWFPITCDGVEFDMLYGTGDLVFVDHVQDGVWQWEIAVGKWEATSTKTGEVFQGKELDKTIPFYNPVTNILEVYGTWRAILHGNRGSRYQITIAVSFTPDFQWSLVKAKCY